MAGYLLAGDVINGQEAEARMTIRDTGDIVDMFYVRNLEATIDMDKVDIRTLGHRATQHKPVGWTGTGTMTIYSVTSDFKQQIVQYIKTGIPVYFDLVITNRDPASTIGVQTVVLKRCSLDSVNFANIDVDAEFLDETVDFTFDDVDLLDAFSLPTNLGQ